GLLRYSSIESPRTPIPTIKVNNPARTAIPRLLEDRVISFCRVISSFLVTCHSGPSLISDLRPYSLILCETLLALSVFQFFFNCPPQLPPRLPAMNSEI